MSGEALAMRGFSPCSPIENCLASNRCTIPSHISKKQDPHPKINRVSCAHLAAGKCVVAQYISGDSANMMCESSSKFRTLTPKTGWPIFGGKRGRRALYITLLVQLPALLAVRKFRLNLKVFGGVCQKHRSVREVCGLKKFHRQGTR